jgi:hypothetical protein
MESATPPPKQWLGCLLTWNDSNQLWEARVSHGRYEPWLVLRSKPDPYSKGELWDAWVDIDRLCCISVSGKETELSARVGVQSKLSDLCDLFGILLGTIVPHAQIKQETNP